MTADEEAAYVREVAEQKTAALRMSLDAVERQGMPFVGETGGRSGDAEADPGPGADRPAPPTPLAERLGRHARAEPSRPRDRARRARTDAAMSVPAMGGGRPSRRPTVARDYLLLALRLDQRSPGLVDGYFGPAELKAQVDMEQLRSPARAARRRRGAARPARRRGGRRPDRRAWLDAQLVALETQAAALAGEPLPYLEHVDALLRVRAAAPRRRRVRGRRGRGIDELLPGDGPLDGSTRGLGPAVRDRRRPAARRRRLAGRAVPRARADRCSGCPTARTCGSRSSPASRGRATTGSTAGGRSRVDINTDLPRPRAGARPTRRPRDVPGPPPRARLEGGRPRRSAVGRLEASILLINTPECLDQRGPGRPRARLRGRPTDERGRPPGRAVRAGRARRSPATRPAAREAAERTVGAGRAAGRASPRSAATPRSSATPTAGRHDEVLAYLRDGRPVRAGDGGQAARVHRAPALADLRLRLRRGRGAPRAAGSTPCRPADRAGAVRPAAPRAADARRPSQRPG